MKIWDIIKEDFEKNNSVDEGWKEKFMAAALGASVALGVKGMDKPIKDEPKKIEYSTTISNEMGKELNKIKSKYVEVLKDNTSEFNEFMNYDPTIAYLLSFDLQSIRGKVAVTDEYNKKYYIDLNSDIPSQIKNIVKRRLVSSLKEMGEKDVAIIINNVR